MEFGSPSHPSPPKKLSRLQPSDTPVRVLGVRDADGVSPSPRSPARTITVAGDAAVSTPVKTGYSQDDLEQLVTLFTPLSIRKPARNRSASPRRRPPSLSPSHTLSGPVPACPDLSVLDSLPNWIALMMCAQLSTGGLAPSALTAEIMDGAAACATLGPCEAVCYLKAKLPHCHWSVGIANAVVGAAQGTVPLLTLTLTHNIVIDGDADAPVPLNPFNCRVSYALAPRGTRMQRQFVCDIGERWPRRPAIVPAMCGPWFHPVWPWVRVRAWEGGGMDGDVRVNAPVSP